MTDAQEYINQNYPDKKIKVLNLENKDLEGRLDLSEFTELEELNCSRNEITSLAFGECPLTKLDCSFNLLDNIDFLARLPEPEKLTFLKLDNCGVFLSQEEMATIFLMFFKNLGKRIEKMNEKTSYQIGPELANHQDLQELKQALTTSQRIMQLEDQVSCQKQINKELEDEIQLCHSIIQNNYPQTNRLETLFSE